MRFIRISVMALLMVAGAASVASSDYDAFGSAMSIAAERYPGFSWDNDLRETVDVNGDGEEDQLLIGLADTDYMVAIALPNSGDLELHYLEFAISRVKHRASCGQPVEWESRSRSERPLNALGAYPPGYEGCTDCLEHVLYDDGGCDPITIYWNPDADRPAWWRA